MTAAPEKTWQILQGDALKILEMLPDTIAQTCVTSPPYWGLRDYQIEGQIGLEKTPEEYVAKLLEVFRELRRVLRDDGTVWLNLGDTYASGGHGGGGSYMAERHQFAWEHRANKRGWRSPPIGLKPKDLVGIPWRVAFALQADGWYLRSDIIWAKPNPMPESVTDRPTKAHEYLFLLAKRGRYYYDGDAIRLPYQRLGDYDRAGFAAATDAGQGWVTTKGNPHRVKIEPNPDGCNRRSVWTIPTEPFAAAHFAVFPPALVEPCVLAGSREADLVLDPFAGSGTVGVVCRKHRRRFLGIEINQRYVNMACARLGANVEPESGEKDGLLPLFGDDAA